MSKKTIGHAELYQMASRGLGKISAIDIMRRIARLIRTLVSQDRFPVWWEEWSNSKNGVRHD